MKDLNNLIKGVVLNEFVLPGKDHGGGDPDRVPGHIITAETQQNLAKLHKTMAAKGYKKKAYKQSATEDHVYTKDGHTVTYSGWHGTGPYGSLKMGLHLFDGHKVVHEVKGHADEDEVRFAGSGTPDTSVSKAVAASHKEFWANVHKHAESL